MQNKKILFISINGFKNDSRMTKQAITLSKLGYEIKIITIHKEGLEETEKNEFFEVIRIKLKSKKWSKIKLVQMLKMYEFNIRIIKYLKKENFIPNVVQVFTPYPLKTAFLIKKKLNNNLKIVYDPREYVTAQDLPKIEKFILSYLEKKYVKKVDKIIVVGDFIAKFYQSDYSLIDKPVILRNIPFYYKKDNNRNNYLKESLNISTEKKILLFQGGLMEGRNLKQLLYVLKKLPENIVLVFMGEGPLKENLRKKVNELNLKERVYFTLINNKKLMKYTNGADLGVCLIENTCKSYYYSLPNKLFEFIQGEIPVICSNFPEMKKIIDEYSIGETVEPNNIDKIIEVIIELLEKKDKYKYFKDNLKIAKKELCWEIEEKKLIELYKKL